MAFRETNQAAYAIHYLRTRGGISGIPFIRVEYHKVSATKGCGGGINTDIHYSAAWEASKREELPQLKATFAVIELAASQLSGWF